MATTSLRLTLVLLLLGAGTCLGQDPPHSNRPLRVNVNLVVVPVTVTDRNGKVITGLDRSSFRVFDNGIPQRIVSFTTEDAAASIGLVLDVSGSMKQRLQTARIFLRSFLDGADPDDEGLFLTCADRPGFESSLTRDLDSLESILQTIKPGGWTALVDSIDVAIDRIKAGRNLRKVLVVVSDGQDNHSRHTRRELLSKVVESDTQIYTVAPRESLGYRKAIELVEEKQGLAFLSDLAQQSGGLYLEIDTLASVAAAAEKINRTLHNQYMIGYYPSESFGSSLRKIQVKLDVPGLRLSARNRYYASSP
jgi:Ca-activated chloride channel family protein